MAVLCTFLVIACYYDYGSFRIPNVLLLGMLLAGAVLRFAAEGGWGLMAFLITVVVMVALLYPFFKIGSIGAGDVKLFGICAGYFPGKQVFLFLFFSMLIAAIFSIIKFFKEKNLKERFRYLGEYLCEVAQTGNWRLYMDNLREERRATLCLSGPVLISVIMHIGGVY